MAAVTLKSIKVEEGSKVIQDKEFFRISPSAVVVNPDENPRTEPIAPEAREALKRSIKEHGQKVPCVLTLDKEGRPVMSSGYNRLDVVKELATTDPECKDLLLLARIAPADDRNPSNSPLITGIIDNNIRNSWSLSDQARAAKKLRETYSYSNVKIGELFGVTSQHVGTMFKLEELPSEIKQAVDEGAVTVSDATKVIGPLSKVAPKEMSKIIADAKKKKSETGKGLTASEVQKAATEVQTKVNGSGGGTNLKGGRGPTSPHVATTTRTVTRRTLKQFYDDFSDRNHESFPVTKALFDYFDAKIDAAKLRQILTDFEVPDETEDELLEYENAAVAGLDNDDDDDPELEKSETEDAE